MVRKNYNFRNNTDFKLGDYVKLATNIASTTVIRMFLLKGLALVYKIFMYFLFIQRMVRNIMITLEEIMYLPI